MRVQEVKREREKSETRASRLTREMLVSGGKEGGMGGGGGRVSLWNC